MGNAPALVPDRPGGVPNRFPPKRGSMPDVLRDMERESNNLVSGGTSSGPMTLSVTKELSEIDLRLYDPPSVANIIHFFEKLEIVSQYSRQNIKIAVHMTPSTRAAIAYNIRFIRRGCFK